MNWVDGSYKLSITCDWFLATSPLAKSGRTDKPLLMKASG